MPNNCRKCQQGRPCNIHKTNSCNLENIARTGAKVAKMAFDSKAAKTGIKRLDNTAGKTTYGKALNVGNYAGQGAFIAHETYKQTCGKK